MSTEFVPLVPSARAQVSQAQSTNVFTPATPGRHSHSQSTSQTCVPAGEVKLEVKREGDRISQIRVQCRCGEIVEIDCEY